MLFIPAHLFMINSLLPLWTGMYFTSIFKKSSISLIAENSINHPYILPKESLILEEQLLHQDEDFIQ